MPIFRLQGEAEKQQGIFYEYDSNDQPLGEGGMGKVYKGWRVSERTGQRREVAIKFLYSDLPPHVIARARREASVQLRNDNLIEMLGFLEIRCNDELGQSVVRYHVVSEFLHGVTLDELLAGKFTDYRGEVIPYAQELYHKYQHDPYHFALTVIRSLLSGLMALHDAGYIHRDIDPSNIMVTAEGHIKLIDFGIAKKINGVNTKESSYTQAGQFIGKPKYAAPELVRGVIDAQGVTTDLYAVGILLYQLITGQVPFEGEMTEVLEMQLTKQMPLHNLKQKAVREVVKIATQKKRVARYQSAAEFRVAIDKLMPLVYPDKPIDKKWFIGGGIAAAVVVLVVLIVALIPSSDGKQEVAVNEPVVDRPDFTYDDVYALLQNQNTTQHGFEMLTKLADNDDPRALFLLSRLYFKSGEEADNEGVDTLQGIRETLNISVDNARAHSLLVKSVKLDNSNYHAEYELGCDYKSNLRGTTRQSDSAYIYLNEALLTAQSKNDTEYVAKISEKMSNLAKPE
jgi:serine/threonine-protein kinase